MSWLTRLLRKSEVPEQQAPKQDEQSDPPVPDWALEMAEMLQKTSRAQAKLAVKLDDLASRVDGGFTQLEGLVKSSQRVQADEVSWDDLLDAMDILEAAVDSSEVRDIPALAEGLRGVVRRLERVLSKHSLTRLAPQGELPDGRLFRVVGSHPEPALPEGVVSRVVRAAVVRGDRVLREGEVLTNRRSA